MVLVRTIPSDGGIGPFEVNIEPFSRERDVEAQREDMKPEDEKR